MTHFINILERCPKFKKNRLVVYKNGEDIHILLDQITDSLKTLDGLISHKMKPLTTPVVPDKFVKRQHRSYRKVSSKYLTSISAEISALTTSCT